jgi:hypothetical protein
VPPELTRRALAKIAAPRPQILDDAEHGAGWREKWPSILCDFAGIFEPASPHAAGCASEISADPHGDRRALPITMPQYHVTANMTDPSIED